VARKFIAVFVGNWNCATDDKFQKDGWSSHFVSRSTWDWKGCAFYFSDILITLRFNYDLYKVTALKVRLYQGWKKSRFLEKSF